MKSLIILFIFVLAGCKAQTLQTVLDHVQSTGTPTNGEINLGLKEALSVSIEKGATVLAQKGGYSQDQLVKILLPEELKGVQKALSKIGMSSLTNKLTLKLNEAAEDAASKSIPIFKKAILSMSFSDVMSIIKGPQDSATTYLKKTTSTDIGMAFKPQISSSLNKVGAVKIWKEVFQKYNMIPFVKKVNTNLVEYTTDKALKGLFVKVAQREGAIRSSLNARTTPLLKKVFGYADTL